MTAQKKKVPKTTKPPRVEVLNENVPPDLKERPQWVCWKYVWQEAKGKWDKPPINPKTGKMAQSNNPKTWSDFETALARYKEDPEIAGIGFEMSDDDPFTGVDLDGCRNIESGEIAPWAEAIVSYLSSYTEISPSGRGVRIFVQGKPPKGGKRNGAVEIYGGGQYLTVTGHRLGDRKIEGREDRITVLHSMLKAKLFSDQAFMKLFAHDDSEYENDWSRGDLAFCARLGRAGLNEVAIDDLVRASSRFRDKWDEIHASEGSSYGRMTIRKALEAGDIPDWLAEMNEKYFVSRIGGKTYVCWEEYDPVLGRSTLQASSFSDFKNFYSNEFVMTDRGRARKGSAWLDDPRRRQYDRAVFHPEGEAPSGCYNLWKGFAVAPIPGDWSLYEQHLREVVCQKVEKYFQYLIQWMAYAVQHPGRPGQVAVVLRGERGAGKGIVAQNFSALFGQHFLQIFSPKHLVGNFNIHLRDCIFLFLDEAFWAGDKWNEGTLKGLITEERIQIEGKGKDVVTAPNMLHVMMATNNAWAIPAGPMERRYFVLDVGSDRIQDKPYFKAIIDQMRREGQAALFHDLFRMDLSGFRISDVPDTEALDHQKIYSMEPVPVYWYERLWEGTMPYQGELGIEYGELWTHVQKDTFYSDYVRKSGMAGTSHKGVQTVVALALRKLLPEPFPKNHRLTDYNGKLKYYWEFPPLEVCRAYFERIMKMKVDWPAVEHSTKANGDGKIHDPKNEEEESPF
jgi:hypothetical protein